MYNRDQNKTNSDHKMATTSIFRYEVGLERKYDMPKLQDMRFLSTQRNKNPMNIISFTDLFHFIAIIFKYKYITTWFMKLEKEKDNYRLPTL